MSACIWCQKEIAIKLSITDLLMFKKLQPKTVCESCMKRFELLDFSSVCPDCSRRQTSSEVCSDCLKWRKQSPDYLFRHQAIFAYNAFAKEWMERFKFDGDIRVASMIAPTLKEAVEKITNVETVVPIPIASSSLAKRGFNQMEIMLNYAGVKYSTLLENQSSGENQATKSRLERLAMEQPFKLKDDHAVHSIKGQRLVVVDDVYTTGRTIRYAAECLVNAGAASVQTVSLFR